MNNETLLQRLAQPFEPSAITWKPGATKDNKCMALCYADFRAYMDRLDEVCGADWSVEYLPWGDNRIIARLTIGGITRASTGEADAQDEKNNLAGSVMEAMAFKRACAMFGLGRYLYSLPNVWIEFDPQRKRITDAGQRELENRYKVWYAKAMAQPTVTIVPVAAIDAAYVDVDFTQENLTPHQKMWNSGLRCFGADDWELGRGWLIAKWTKHVTPDNPRTSAGDLSDTEKAQLAAYINEQCGELKKIWARQRAQMLQSTN